jgi:DNA-binding transcriptional regulator YhcF (GntR family)
VSEGRRGTRVTPRLPDVDVRTRSNALRDAIEQFVSALVGRGYSRAEIAEEVRRYAG